MDAHDWYEEADSIWREWHGATLPSYPEPDGWWLNHMTPFAWCEELELRIRLEG